MNWLIAAFLSPALFAVSNHLDKYLMQTYFRKAGVGALIIFSSLIYLLALPLLYIFKPAVFGVSVLQAFLLITECLLGILGILIYLWVMKKEETSVVVPFFQTIPIFYLVLGYIVLGEILTLTQILGSFVIIIGSTLLSLDLGDRKKLKIKFKVLLPMLLSSFLLSLTGLIFKYVALETDFWTSTFWEYTGAIIASVIFLGLIPTYRREFISVFNKSGFPVVALNAANEAINLTGTLALRFASMFAPLALVQVIGGFQSVFAFVYGIILSLFFPKWGKEDLATAVVIQKILTITLILIGTYILFA